MRAGDVSETSLNDAAPAVELLQFFKRFIIELAQSFHILLLLEFKKSGLEILHDRGVVGRVFLRLVLHGLRKSHSGGGACHATNRRLQSGNHQVQFPQYTDLADQSVPVLKMLPEAGGSMTWQRKSGLLPRPCASSGVW